MGCARPASPTPALSFSPAPTGIAAAEAEFAPSPTAQELPTLVPTFTPRPTLTPGPTATPRPTRPPSPTETPIPFDEVVVSLRYAIPALGLERRLEGNVAGQIGVSDEASGVTVTRENQGGVLLEMRQVLRPLDLEPVPEGCDRCVAIEYDLPLVDAGGAGWLQDSVLLASFENFMTVALGPYFPPETALGLRRSASPYAPAHTLALTADGRLWRWLATDAEIGEPLAPDQVAPPAEALLAGVPLSDLNENYVAHCPGAPAETLWLNPSGEQKQIFVVCPEFALPSTLLPLYLALDELLAPTIAPVSLPRPAAAFPLAAMLDYKRADGARLTLYLDGTAVTVAPTAEVYTSTVPLSQMDDLVGGLLDSGELSLGLGIFRGGTSPPSSRSLLLLRGPDGVYDGQWEDIPDFSALNALLDALLPAPLATLTPPATAASKAAPTPTP